MSFRREADDYAVRYRHANARFPGAVGGAVVVDAVDMPHDLLGHAAEAKAYVRHHQSACFPVEQIAAQLGFKAAYGHAEPLL